MIHKTMRRRTAALTSGAVAALGLVVVPAIAGLSPASAAPVTLNYTCAGSSPVGPISMPGTITIETTPPASAAPGSTVPTGITMTADFGSLSMGPVTQLTGSFDIPLTLGSSTATFTSPTQTVPNTALVYTGTGSVDLTAPAALGDAPITVGTIVGNFSAMGIPITTTCTPAAGQNLTVGNVNVAGGGEPEGLEYTCVLTGGPSPMNLPSTVTLTVDPPASATAGEPYEADVDVTIDMGNLALGPVGGFTGELDLDFLTGDQASVGTLPIDPVTLVPNEKNDVVLHAAGPVELLAPATPGTADIDIATITRRLQASVFGTNMPNDGDCTPDAGQDLTVGSIDVEQAEPVAVPVTGTVKITGTPKVGKTLKAVPGTTDGATVKYQWLSGGKAIKGATKPSLKLTKAMKGKKVTVKATYSKNGFLKTVQTSKAVTVKK